MSYQPQRKPPLRAQRPQERRLQEPTTRRKAPPGHDPTRRGGEPDMPRYLREGGEPGSAPEAQGSEQTSEIPRYLREAPVAAGPAKPELGPAQPLAPELASHFSRAYGQDLSQVRVHPASPVPGGLGARALTTGKDVAFAAGEYRPESTEGRKLIGHELAHVVQQSSGKQGPQAKGLSSDSLEQQADQAAEAAVSGGEVPELAPAGGEQVQAKAGPGQAPAAAGKPAASAPQAGEVDLSQGMLNPASLQLDSRGQVMARLGGLAAGNIKLVRKAESYSSKGQGSAIPLTLPSLEWVEGLVLVVQVQDNAISGYVSLGKGNGAFVSRKDKQLFGSITGNPEALRLGGLSRISAKPTKNALEGGVLNLGAQLDFTVGGWVSGSGELGFANGDMSFGGNATVELPGGSGGAMEVKWNKEAGLSGEASLKVSLGKVSGGVAARLHDGVVDAQGTVGYAGDKLKGSMTLVAIDAETARNFHTLDPQAGELPAGAEGGAGGAGAPAAGGAPGGAGAGAKAGPRAFAGWGELDFALTEWFTGRAKVVVNSTGEATIKGEIAPPKEIILFEQKEWTRSLAKVEVRASYGIPVVGNVFLFANIGLEALATVGPGKLYNIKLSGQYSTDKAVDRELSLQATLNISAFAGLRLRAEGGAGVELLGHDIKAGVGVWALAGVRGYVEATPTIGYREKGGGPGEFYIKGHMELAAQPFLGLGGDLFVEVDSPWWSPLGDEKWTWPLGSLEYPLPGEFGIGADVEHVLGSKQWPSVSFTEVEFDSSRFMGDLLSGGGGGKGKGGEEKKPAKWAEGGGGGGAGAGAQGKGGADGGGKGAGAGGGGGAGPQSTGKGKGKGKGKGAEAKGKGPTGKDAQGKDGKGKGKGKGSPAAEQPTFTGPIGETVSFSDGQQGHRLWVESKGGHATLMVASEQMTVDQRLARWESSVGELSPKQQPNARNLIARARSLLREVKDDASQLAALQKAAASAKEYQDRKAQGGKKGRQAPGAKKPPQQLNQEVKSDEHKLADTLAALFRLFGEKKVLFRPVSRKAPMAGGSEQLRIENERDTPVLKVRGEKVTQNLFSIFSHLSQAKNPAGRDATSTALSQVRPLEQELAKMPITNDRIDARQYARLPALAESAATAVGTYGKAMKIGTLPRALQLKPIQTKVITFNFHDLPNPYKEKLKAEVQRQLQMQQDGLNQMRIDDWLANVDTYKSQNFDNIKDLTSEAKQAVVAELMERANAALAEAQHEKALVDQAVKDAQKRRAAAQLALDAALKDLANVKTLDKSKRKAARDDARSRRDAARRELAEAERDMREGTNKSNKLAGRSSTSGKAVSDLGVDATDDTQLQPALASAEVSEFSARYDNVEEWKRLHKEAIETIEADTALMQQWEGLTTTLKVSLALLHNPDQVAGGKGLFDLSALQPVAKPGPGADASHVQRWNDYLQRVKDHLGPQYVNGRLGGFPGKGERPDGWPAHLGELKLHVTNHHPQTAHYIWRMSVSLRHRILRPVGR